MKTKVSLFLFLVLNMFSFSVQALMIDDDEVKINHISAVECSTCHKEIYDQWKGSMHAQSTALKDPIHAGFYKKVMGDPKKEGLKSKKGKYPVCLKCHVPNAAIDKKTKIDTMASYNEGVNCLVCHSFKKFKGTRKPNGKLRLGISAYETSNMLQGPSGFFSPLTKAESDSLKSDDKKENPHVINPFIDKDDREGTFLPLERNARVFKSNSACLGCHDKRNNGHGVPLCATGAEFVAGKSQVTCQSCHMPISNGRANHSMGGGHDNAMLKKAIVLTTKSRKAGRNIMFDISLLNRQPHKVPTGAPFRNMTLKVTAYDGAGKKVWSNFKKHPGKEDPKAYFVMGLVDGKGKPTGPPTAKGLGPDNRINAYETRRLHYSIPAKGVKTVRAELYYNLLWAKLNKKMKKLPKDLKASKLIAHSETKF